MQVCMDPRPQEEWHQRAGGSWPTLEVGNRGATVQEWPGRCCSHLVEALCRFAGLPAGVAWCSGNRGVTCVGCCCRWTSPCGLWTSVMSWRTGSCHSWPCAARVSATRGWLWEGWPEAHLGWQCQCCRPWGEHPCLRLGLLQDGQHACPGRESCDIRHWENVPLPCQDSWAVSSGSRLWFLTGT